MPVTIAPGMHSGQVRAASDGPGDALMTFRLKEGDRCSGITRAFVSVSASHSSGSADPLPDTRGRQRPPHLRTFVQPEHGTLLPSRSVSQRCIIAVQRKAAA